MGAGDEPLDPIFADYASDGNIVMPLALTGNGKYGLVADRFGIQWMINWSLE